MSKVICGSCGQEIKFESEVKLPPRWPIKAFWLGVIAALIVGALFYAAL